MKITIQNHEFSYSYDSSFNDKNNDGDFSEQYEPSVGEAVDAALSLLACIYSLESVAEYINGDIPAKEYAKED